MSNPEPTSNRQLGTWWYVPQLPNSLVYFLVEIEWRGVEAFDSDDRLYPSNELHLTERAAISVARAYRIAEIEQLQAEIDAWDRRVDEIEEG